MYEVGMNIVRKGGLSDTLSLMLNCQVWMNIVTNGEKKEPWKGLVGIKNSWKYEKDLIIIFNSDWGCDAIRQVGNSALPKWAILI